MTSPPAPIALAANQSNEERAVARPLGITWPRALLVVAIVAYALWFAWLTLSRFWALESRALDMGNLHQAIWNTAHGNWFHQTNQPGATIRLSLHVEPILLPIAALFRLLPYVEFLLVLQTLTVALGAIPLFALGERRFAPSIGVRSAGWLALLFALGWLAMPAIQAANWLEFHPVTLAPTFFIAAFYFLYTRRAGWFALFAVLAAACKEDLGLIVFLLGLYAWLAQGRRGLGWTTMALGLGWSLFAVLGIQNSFGGNIHWGRYDWLGESPPEIVRTLITRPLYVWQHLVETEAARYLIELLAPMGFLALLAPEVFLLALPSLGVNLLADFPPMHEVNTLIYAAPIAPFVALGAVMGAGRLLDWLQRRSARGQPGAQAALHAAPWAIGALLAAGMIWGQVDGGYLPGGANARLFRPTAHDLALRPLLAQIGRDEAVSAQDKLNPHTAGRFTSFIFPRVDDPAVANADVVLVDVTGPAWPQHPNDLHASIQTLLADDFGVAAATDGYLLLRRGEPQKSPGDGFYSPWRGPWPAPGVPPPTGAPVRFGEDLELLGVDMASDEHGEVVVRSQWRALRPIEAPLTIRMIYQTVDGNRPFDSRFYPPVVTLWYPVSQWETGETVLVTSLPWALEDETFSLLLGVEGAPDSFAPVDAPALHLADDGRLLNMGLFERQAGQGLADRLTRVRPWLPATPLPATLDAPFALDGGPLLQLEAAQVGATQTISGGQAIPVTLQWRLLEPPAADLNVAVHLLEFNSDRVSQWDGPPRNGAVPVATSRLAAGDRLLGSLLLPLPADARGDYTVVVGLYDWQTGATLTLPDGASAVPVGAVRVR